MKFIKLLSYLLITFVSAAFIIILYKIFFLQTPSIPFIYGLKTKQTLPVSYLNENNSSILQENQQTVGIFSVKKDNFFLQEIFQTAGIPYIFKKNLQELSNTKILFLDFDIDTPVTLTNEEKIFLYHYVKNGGVVIGNEILPTRYGVLKELFGYKGFYASQNHYQFKLLNSPYFHYLDTIEEQTYTLSTISQAPYTNTIELGAAKPLATYEDNTTAISLNHYGKGIAINLGISLFDLRYRNLFAKDFHANKESINHFEPLSDFIVLFLKGLYESYLKQTLTLHTAKNGHQATVIMTHDINFNDAFQNISKFLDREKKLGIKATYNIQTKYITDYKNKAFFLPKNFKFLQEIQSNGHEIGAHTVFQTQNFFLLPEGNCKESYPSYKPFSLSALKDTGNPTLCAEIKVSKELLLGMGLKNIVTFRNGELLYHPNLPQTLEKFGYKYSSCFSAENILSYFPYRYMYDYKTLSKPSKIWEIPLVLEDNFFPPIYFRLNSTLDLFHKIYNNGAVFTMLNHTDLTFYKLKNLDLTFIEKFYTQLPNDVWKATIKEVGEYWDKRDRVTFRYSIDNNILTLSLYSFSDIEGLTFKLNGIKVIPTTEIKLVKDKLVINVKKGFNQWQFHLLSSY